MLHLACAADARYAPHSAAMLHSVLAHRGSHEVRVHYLQGPDFPPDAAQLLAEMIEREGGSVSFLRVSDEWLAGLPTFWHVTETMWSRIYLPELLPDVERVLYLDVDTLAVDSLDALWATDIDGSYLAAVTNVFEPWHLGRPAELGLPGPEAYFNSGVLLFNLEEMRRDGCTAALREYASVHREELLWPDQDALNVVLGGRRVALHPRWNCMNSVLNFPWSAQVFGPGAVEEARRRPGIRHFEGPEENKPWHYLCDHDLRELYREHRAQTPWPSYRLEGVTPRNVWKRLRGDTPRRRVSA